MKAMRAALDEHTRSTKPTVVDITERIGPLRNKMANESGADAAGAPRRERRRARG
jgi:5-methyltetrahydrofolate--homocysteine methyltransferase